MNKPIKIGLILIAIFTFAVSINTNLFNSPLKSKLIIKNAKTKINSNNLLKINKTELKRGDTKELEIEWSRNNNQLLCKIFAEGLKGNDYYLLGAINLKKGFDTKNKTECDVLEVSSSASGVKYYANCEQISFTKDFAESNTATKINLNKSIYITIRDFDLINVNNYIEKDNTLKLIITNSTSEPKPLKIIDQDKDEEDLAYKNDAFEYNIKWSGITLNSEPPKTYEVKIIKPYDARKSDSKAPDEYITLGTISLIPGVNVQSAEYQERKNDEPIKYSGILKIETNNIPKYYTNKASAYESMYLPQDIPDLIKNLTLKPLNISGNVNLNGTVYITIYDTMNVSSNQPKLK